MFKIGKASEAEKIFARFDTDGDGHLTVDELVTAVGEAKGGKMPVRARVEHLLPQFDKDGSGALELQEFMELLAYLERGHRVADEMTTAWGMVEEARTAVEEARRENEALRAQLGALKAAPSTPAASSLPEAVAGGTEPRSPESGAPPERRR